MINFYEEALKRKDDLLKDLITLVQIPSVDDPSTAGVNQPFGKANRDALDAMLAIGKRDGYVVDEVEWYAGHIDIGDKEETVFSGNFIVGNNNLQETLDLNKVEFYNINFFYVTH